jgi:hypothetical protein
MMKSGMIVIMRLHPMTMTCGRIMWSGELVIHECDEDDPDCDAEGLLHFCFFILHNFNYTLFNCFHS